MSDLDTGGRAQGSDTAVPCAAQVTGRRLDYALLGAFWLGLYALAVALPLIVLLISPVPQGREFLRELSVGFGFAGTSIMCVQFALTARFKRVQAPYGIDLVYHFHREITYVALALVILHPVLLIVVDVSNAALFNVISAPWRARFALIATLALVVLVVSSVWRKTFRLPYEAWRRLHAILAVIAVAAAPVHFELGGPDVNSPAKRVVWVVYPAFWLSLLVWTQVVKPILIRRRPYLIEAVRPAADKTWTLDLRPSGHEGLRFHPGQFAWVSLDRRPFGHREHPFSFSSGTAELPRISFTIRERGDFTSGVGTLQPGTKIYLDGPFGHFSYLRHPAPGYVFIAGGIGITPILSLLRSLAAGADARPLHLIYVARDLSRVVFLKELDDLTHALDLKIHYVLRDPPAQWEGEQGRLNPAMLGRLLPADKAGYHFYVCGPDEMMDMVENELLRAGVSFGRVHSERFALV
jgi:predicted ferric reductase